MSDQTRRVARAISPVFVLLVLLAASGCSSVAYYGQAVSGQLSLLMKRRPIADVISDPATPAEVRDKLLLTLDIRRFASELGLPVGDSYATYADLGRTFVVWNVFAAPEFSVRLESHCFPIAGCVTYRGYFSEAAARQAADDARREGFEVYLGGVAAYSTLGWFDDPVLNTFIARSDARFAGLLFHELAHKAVYVKGDTTFNESFATTVERAALARWLSARGDETGYARYLAAEAQRQAVVSLIIGAREELDALYQSGLPADDMRHAKQRVFDDLRTRYAALGEGYPYAAWMAGELNNAKLGTVAEYHGWVPAFTVLLADSGGEMDTFLERVEALARLDKAARDARLSALSSRAAAPPPT